MRTTPVFSHLVLLFIFVVLMVNNYSQINANPIDNIGYSALSDTNQMNPVINSIPVIKATVGSMYQYTVHASGRQNGMVYLLSAHPAGMTIDSTSGLIRWTPGDVLEDGFVRLIASNNVPPADTQTFRINIAEATDCPDGLFVLLKLDETTGPHYSDHFGIHNIEAAVAPVSVEGILNGAQLFDSATVMDIPDLGSEFNFSADASFSYEYWLRTSSTATMVCLGRHRLDSEGTAFMYVGTDKEGSGKAALELRDNRGTLDILKGNKFIADGEWHHFIAVRDAGAGVNKIYVDGVEDAGDSVVFDSSFATEVPTEINIGSLHRLKTGEPTYHFKGALDEIAIYDRAVTPSEALNHFNNGHPAGLCGSGDYAPVITSLPDTVARPNELYSYAFNTDDLDSADLLVLSAVDKPSWLAFSWETGQKSAILEGTPGNAEAGIYPVLLRVSDGHIQRDQSFTIRVENTVNLGPVITSSPVLSASVGDLYAYLFTAEDPDDTILTKTAILLPDWLHFNPSNGVLAGIPLAENTGENEIILRVSDGSSYVDQDFKVIVNGPSGLEEPLSEGIHIFPVPAGDYLNFTFDRPFKEISIEVINSLGNIVAIKVLPAYTEKYVLDLAGLGNGMYFLEIKTGTKTVKAEFVLIK